MALETVTDVGDLVATNPTSGDPKAQGDDHLRNIKTALAATLPVDAPVYPLTSGTATASTSGTAINFTSIPSWVKRVTVMFSGVSLNGATNLLVRLGSAGIATVGYLSGSFQQDSDATSTIGFVVLTPVASDTIHGTMTISLVDAATYKWVASHNIYRAGGGVSVAGAGSITLSAALDTVRITTTNGTSTFDAGTVNILYE